MWNTRRTMKIVWKVLVFQQLFLLAHLDPVLAKISDEETVSVSDTQAVAGGVAKLPCDISPPTAGDKVHLVIWYKENADSPIYSFDSRGKNFGDAKHWADEQTLGGRAFFRFTDEPAKLTVESVKDADGGVYRCRVDFKKSPTRNTKVNLTVLLPPEKLLIMDDRGGGNIPQYILGPYNEGSAVNITCVAFGGRPSPRVTWWQENALLDDTYRTLSDNRVQNVLRLEKLGRSHLHAVLTCQASNNNLVAPVSSAVTLDMNLRPLSVRLQGENLPLSADNTYELSCEAVGARPQPVMSWMKGSIPMRNTRETTSPDGNTTTSTLTFVPTMEDGGKILTCRAGTPLIPDSTMEDGWKLNIHHVPIVTLELGSNLNATVIREGIDVYFECNIKSNPWVYKVSWRHNGKTLYNNASVGTIVTNQSLVLQNVNRGRAGLYTCVGSNQEGDGESNPVYLDVKYAPVCKSTQQKVYGVGRQEAARILCDLDANPNDVHFVWRFNNTSETVDIQASHFTTDRARSTATYTPMTELDYGSLLCMGRNDQGVQQAPCVFHVIPAGKPDGLHNCTIVNQTAESLLVECTDGFDGGLTQEFVMEVYDAVTQNLVSNVTSRTPSFTVTGLESGLGFDVSLYAANRKGKSDPTSLHAYTLKAPEKRTATPTILHITPILGLLIGIVSALVLVAVIIVVVMRLRGHSGDDDVKERDDGGMAGSCVVAACADKPTVGQTKDGEDSADSVEEKNPDIIPHNTDTDYQDPDEKAFEHLNNAPNRIYANSRLQSPNMYEHVNNVSASPRTSEEITYAELSLPKQQLHNAHPAPTSILRRQQLEPTVYAQIAPAHELQPLTFQHPASLPLLHHHHTLAAAYQHASHTLPHRPLRPLHVVDEDPQPSADTPLIAPQKTQVGIQPESARSSTLTRVTTTRF